MKTPRRKLYLALVLLLGVAPAARAEDQPPSDLKAAAEHVEDPGNRDDIANAPEVAQRLFRDLVCLCGGCKRETLDKCPCAYAKAERAKVMAMLSGKDITTTEAQEKAYVAVRDALIKEYGGQHILTVPVDVGFNKLAWIVPWAVFGLAFTLVLVVGKRWVRRGRQETQAARAGAGASAYRSAGPADEEREDRLDDELRDID
jgi:cytochrome c-type biogenesis protein CcmH/NrfF